MNKIFTIVLLSLIPMAPAVVEAFELSNLRCEYRVDPLGIDSANPRLEWKYKTNISPERGLSQSAYEVIVSSAPTLLAENKGD